MLPTERNLVREGHFPRERAVGVPAISSSYFPSAERNDLYDILNRLWRHRKLVLALTIAFGFAATFIAVNMPSHYVAEARVLVGVPEPRIYKLEPYMTDPTSETDRIQSESFIVQSRDLAKQVIERLHLQDNPEINTSLDHSRSVMSYLSPSQYIPSGLVSWLRQKPTQTNTPPPAQGPQDDQMNRMIDNLQGMVDASVLGRSNVLSIQADSQDPNTAAAIANTLADVYLQQQRGDKIDTSNRIEKYLQDRIAELRQQVEKSEQAVEDYRQKNGLFKGENANVTSQQLTELNTQLITAQTAKAEADAKLNEAMNVRKGGMQGDSLPEVLSSPVIQSLKQQETEAERKLAELKASYGEQHPKIINAKAEVADIHRKIQTEVNRAIESLRLQARTAGARYAALRQDFDHTQGQMGSVNEKSIRLTALEREASVDRNLLEAVLSRAKEALGQENLHQPDAKLVSAAAPPGGPSHPPKGLIVFLGTLGGLLAGAMSALLRESADRTFRRSDQIEKLTGLPVLSMVPNFKGSMQPTVHVLRNQVSHYSEALRKIYIALELSESEQDVRTVIFASSTPAEGKSMMVASLGRLLASNGKRIMLIDCDWRAPNLHRLFRCPNKGGLAALLTNEEIGLDEIVYNDALSGLDLMPAGNWNPQSLHMLTSERMRLVLKTFAKNYDLVILDTPPVLVGPEVLSLARMVDKVAFAVRWGHTRREVALEALKQLLDARADVAGAVLSRVDPKRYRQYGYGRMNYQYPRPALTGLR